MQRPHLSLAAVVLAVLLGNVAGRAAEPKSSENWAESLFEAKEVDFGWLPRGIDATRSIKLTNRFKETVHVAYVYRNYAFIPRIETDVLQSRATTTLQIECDTIQHQGIKTYPLRVVFDSPFYAEVRLRATANIDSSTVVEPGSVQLGRVQAGQSLQGSFSVRHAGAANWKIVKVSCPHPGLDVSFREKRREPDRQQPKYFQIAYEVTVTVRPDARVGKLDIPVTIELNDEAGHQFSMPVHGEIVASRLPPRAK